MPDKRSTAEIRTISDVRSQLNKRVNRLSRDETRVIVERSGVPVAGIVSAEDMDRLARLDEEDRDLWWIVDEMRDVFRDVPPEEIEREAELAIAQVRAAMRAEPERIAN